MAVDPLSGSSFYDPERTRGANDTPAEQSPSEARAMPAFSGPPLPVSMGGRDQPPHVSGNDVQTLQPLSPAAMALKTTLEVVTRFCGIQALRMDGYPLTYSTEELARALVSEDVKHVVIAGAFAKSSGTTLAVGAIYVLGRQLEHFGKQVTYYAPVDAVDHIALESLSNVGSETAAKSEYRGLDVERTLDGPSADSEVLARLRGELSRSDLVLSIEDKQR